MSEVVIYTLTNPFSKKVFYVGQTRSIGSRLINHRVCRNWGGNEKPIIEELDRCSEEDKFKVEAYWINQLTAWGFELKNRIVPGLPKKKPTHLEKNHLKTGCLTAKALNVIIWKKGIDKEFSKFLKTDMTSFYDMVHANSKTLTHPYLLLRLSSEMKTNDFSEIINKPK